MPLTLLGLLAIQVATTVAGTLLRSMLRKTPEAQDLQFPTTDEGTPIPVIWGIGQVAPVIVCVGAIRKENHSPLLGTPYTYYSARMQAVVCLGLVDELNDIQFGERSIRLYHFKDGDNGPASDAADNTDVMTSSGAPFTLPNIGGLTGLGAGGYDAINFEIHARQLFGGKHQGGGVEGVVSFKTGKPGTSSVAQALLAAPAGESVYPDMCIIDFGGINGGYITDGSFYWCANSPTPPPVTVLVGRRPAKLRSRLDVDYTYLPNPIGIDANPMEILFELLTDAPASIADNTGHGAGISPDLVDQAGWQAVSDVLAGERFGLSYTWTRQSSYRSVVDEVLRHIDAEMYQDPATGLFTVTLARQDYDVGDLLEITPSNADELEFDRQGWRDTVNEVRIKYRQYDGGTAGIVTGETLTPAFRLNMGIAVLGRYQCQGRNISAYTVHNVTQAVTLVEGTDYAVDAATGMFTFTLTANVALGDELTVDYTAAPTFVGFRDATAQAQDLGNREATGEVRSLTLEFPMVTQARLAQFIANRELSKRMRPLATARWKMSRAGHTIRPAGVVKLTWPDYDLSALPMRVVSVDYGTLEDDAITVEAMEDVWGVLLTEDAAPADIGHDGGACPPPSGVTGLSDSDGMYVQVFGAADTSVYGVELEVENSSSATTGTTISFTQLYAGRGGETRSVWLAADAWPFVRARHTDVNGILAPSEWTPWSQVAAGDKTTIPGTPPPPVFALQFLPSESLLWPCQLSWASQGESVKYLCTHFGAPSAEQARAGASGGAYGWKVLDASDMAFADSPLSRAGESMQCGMVCYSGDPSGVGLGLESAVAQGTTGARTSTDGGGGGTVVPSTPDAVIVNHTAPETVYSRTGSIVYIRT